MSKESNWLSQYRKIIEKHKNDKKESKKDRASSLFYYNK
jgi:hypothetical protein